MTCSLSSRFEQKYSTNMDIKVNRLRKGALFCKKTYRVKLEEGDHG